MGAKWQSYSKYLSLNSAIVFQTPDEENYNMWSYSRAMKSGWMFRTPVWGRYGNGYIYDDSFIQPDEARIECENILLQDITIGNKFKFDPGCLDKAWIKNCCAIGLSAGFVEPMEATAIGSSIQQAFLLMHKITNYNNKDIENYNKSYNDIMSNIRDFIVLHYLIDKKDTPFWEKATSMAVPDSLSERLLVWENRLPILEDFNDLTSYIMFADKHFLLILEGIGFFNKKSIKNNHLKINLSMQNNAKQIIDEIIKYEKTTSFIKHKDYLNFIRNYK